MSVRTLVIGNWKMNGSRALTVMLPRFGASTAAVEVAICPPFPLIPLAVATDAAIAVGAQDCHAEPSGAYTGAVAAPLLAELGATLVIVGHSERRALGECDADVARKATAALAAGLRPVICVGEAAEGRDDAGEAVAAQLRASLPEYVAGGVIVAYEPVWAIGSGRTPDPAYVAAIHARLRALLVALHGVAAGAAVPIVYGGSVDADNAAAFTAQPNVDGVLVGTASLDPEHFRAVIAAVA